jgi:hypothetical protein
MGDALLSWHANATYHEKYAGALSEALDALIETARVSADETDSVVFAMLCDVLSRDPERAVVVASVALLRLAAERPQEGAR